MSKPLYPISPSYLSPGSSISSVKSSISLRKQRFHLRSSELYFPVSVLFVTDVYFPLKGSVTNTNEPPKTSHYRSLIGPHQEETKNQKNTKIIYSIIFLGKFIPFLVQENRYYVTILQGLCSKVRELCAADRLLGESSLDIEGKKAGGTWGTDVASAGR